MIESVSDSSPLRSCVSVYSEVNYSTIWQRRYRLWIGGLENPGEFHIVIKILMVQNPVVIVIDNLIFKIPVELFQYYVYD